MADAIKQAMKERMAEHKPNSGHRPPGLTVTSDERVCCATCNHWDNGTCRLFSYSTQPNEVSESWAPKPT